MRTATSASSHTMPEFIGQCRRLTGASPETLAGHRNEDSAAMVTECLERCRSKNSWS